MKNENTIVNVHKTIETSFSMNYLPTTNDYDPNLENQFDYYKRTGRFPTSFQDIPRASIFEIASNFCDYLALRKAEEWAIENINTKKE